MTRLLPRLLIVIVAGFIAGAALGLALIPGVRDRLASEPRVETYGEARVGGPFTLVDHSGRTVTDHEFRGRYMLVLFGFTNCPDVCPAGLQVMSAVLDKLGAKAKRIVPLFISLDPARDTAATLAEYVRSFHPRLVGLTGEPAEIAKVAKAYKVYYAKVADERSTAGYTIDHSAYLFFMGPDGRYVAHFAHATSADELAAGIAKAL